MSETWTLTEHWLRDHSSHGLTEAYRRHLMQLNRPLRAQICKNCEWPASIGELCMLCCDMAEAIIAQPGLMREHEIWRQMRLRRKAGLL
jgi:hypothetical protein